MDEYHFINTTFKEIITNYHNLITTIYSKLSNLNNYMNHFETQLSNINTLIIEIYNIFNEKIYNYDIDIDNYDLFNISIYNFPLDTQLSILLIRIDNYIEVIRDKIKTNDIWYYHETITEKSYLEFLENRVNPLKSNIKIYRNKIIELFLKILELKNSITTIDINTIGSHLSSIYLLYQIFTII